MMRDYESLVKRLREAPNDWYDADLHYEAADAIEELSKLKWIGMEERKKMTNADKIRAMSDEELADYLRYYSDSYARYDMDWLDWLKQEVENDD